MTLREQYFAEEAQGIQHDVDVDTYIVKKLQENWDEDEWNNLVDKIEEGFVQKYNEEGVPIVTNDDGWVDEDWNDILKEEYIDEEAHGFKHDSTGALIPKRDENGVAILPASWDEDNDEDWEEYC